MENASHITILDSKTSDHNVCLLILCLFVRFLKHANIYHVPDDLLRMTSYCMVCRFLVSFPYLTIFEISEPTTNYHSLRRSMTFIVIYNSIISS